MSEEKSKKQDQVLQAPSLLQSKQESCYLSDISDYLNGQASTVKKRFYLSPVIKFRNCVPRMQATVGPTSPPDTGISDIAPVKASISSTLV